MTVNTTYTETKHNIPKQNEQFFCNFGQYVTLITVLFWHFNSKLITVLYVCCRVFNENRNQ